MTEQGRPPVGSAAQEAARLFAVVEDWARNRGQSGAEAHGDAHTGPAAASCGVCPLCSGIALLRDVRPETVEHLLDAAASVVAAVRSAVVTPPDPDAQRPTAGRTSGVEHIDVQEG